MYKPIISVETVTVLAYLLHKRPNLADAAIAGIAQY
jgi:hypothetical protein